MATVTQSQPEASTKASAPANSSKTVKNKKSHAIPTHSTTTFAGLCRVKFEYADETKEPVRNRCVAYWMYDSSGSKIDNSPLSQQNWALQNMVAPVSVGQTDGDGYLLSSIPPGVQLSTKNQNGVYAISTKRFPAPKTADKTFSFQAVLPMGKKMGFVLCPIDMLQSIETGDLTKLTTKQGAVSVTVETDEQVVQLKGSLPDWQYRIQAATETLKSDLENYQKYTQKHYESIGQLEMLSSVAWNMGRFPADHIGSEEINSLGNVTKQLTDLKDAIHKRFIINTSPDSLCGKFLGKIEGSAKKLIALFQSKDFIKEWKKYIHDIDDANSKGVTFPVESDWRDILETITDAFAALSRTSMAEKIFGTYIAPILVKIAHLGVEGTPEWSEPSSVEAPSDMPLMVLIDRLGTIIQAAATPAPGTATLIEGLVDAFGLVISKWMSGLPRSQVKMPKDLLYGLMRIFKGGKSLSMSEKGVLAKAAYAGKLADGKKSLYDFSKEYMEKTYGARAAKMFARLMFVFALVSLYNAMGSNEKDTLKRWLTITATAPPAAATFLQAFFSKYLEKELKLTAKLGMKTVGDVAGSLAAVAGIAAAILSFMDANEAYGNYEKFKGGMLLAQGLASILLTAGYFMMFFGAGTSWGGVGIVIAALGAIVYVGTSIILIVKDLVEEGTYQVFKQIMEEFSKERSTFKLVYSKDGSSPTIEKLFDDLKRTVNTMHWWDLSWRAIVPLFNAGFKAYRENGNEVFYGESAKLISKLIKESTLSTKGITYRSDYGKDVLVLDYIYDFLRAQKSNDDFDKNGIPDAVEWMNGTIYPDRQPGVNSDAH